MKKLTFLILIMPLVVFLGSCDDDKAEQTFNATYPVSGEWVVNEYYEGDDHAYGPYHLQIFNTANSEDSVWISNVYGSGVKIKAIVNADKTFSTEDAPDINEAYAYASVVDGRIIDTDSIHFTVVLYKYVSNQPVLEAEFVTAGRRWTGLEGE